MPKTRGNIVWQVSYPKSGNTWFRLFLSNLFSDSNQPVNINELYETPSSSKREIIDRYLGIHSSELTNEVINNLRPEVYKKISEELEKLSYNKTHDAWILNSEVKPLFPEDTTRGVIYIIRNPLDVVISYSFHNTTTIDQAISLLNNMKAKVCARKDILDTQTPQILISWSDPVISWFDRSKLPVYVIRFEDMLDDPRNAFGKAMAFLHWNMRNLKSSMQKKIVHLIYYEKRSPLKHLRKGAFIQDRFSERAHPTNGEPNYQIFKSMRLSHIINRSCKDLGTQNQIILS